MSAFGHHRVASLGDRPSHLIYYLRNSRSRPSVQAGADRRRNSTEITICTDGPPSSESDRGRSAVIDGLVNALTVMVHCDFGGRSPNPSLRRTRSGAPNTTP